jgi:uncharacterized protein YgbK (DUF1537 family)
MTGRNPLWLSFYGDDLTGSTDALEQLSLAGVNTMLFLEPPTPAQLRALPGLQACGVAGLTRSLAPGPLAKTLRAALLGLRALGAQHVHYKICSTFDSSPTIGNLGRVLDVAAEIFPAKFVPLLVAAPGLGRYTVFGNHFARFGIGSTGEIHRLDRHPAISRHPVTPMKEADLRRHLARQTRRRVALFDILQLSLPLNECRASFDKMLATQPDVILFDALAAEHLPRIGGLIDRFGNTKNPLFSIGSSGIEAALCGHWQKTGRLSARPPSRRPARAADQVLIGSGSCSPVTSAQIAWALKNGFAEVALNAVALASPGTAEREQQRAIKQAAALLQAGRSVIVHTTRRGLNEKIQKSLQSQTAEILGTALGQILLGALRAQPCRLCLAGGDTASFAARALNITALSLITPLTPGAPLCRAHTPEAPVDGLEMVLKGGQVGAENFFGIVKSGNKIL